MKDYAELIRLAPVKVVGLKQVLYHLTDRDLSCVVLARDADAEFRRRVRTAAAAAETPVLDAPSSAELGSLAGIDVPSGTVGIIEQLII